MIRRVSADRNGSAAVEMALVLPLLLLLLFGSLEVANYFLAEHALVKSVRDGAVYAARRDINDFDCTSNPPSVSSDLLAKTQSIVRTGAMPSANAPDRLPLWTANGASIAISLQCVTAAPDATALSGIYAINGGKVPVITLTATVPYQPVSIRFGFDGRALSLNASQNATVSGT